MTLNNPTGRTVTSATREQALASYYAAERNAGVCPLVACERMGEFAKRLDAEFERDLEVIRKCLEGSK